MSEPDTHAPYWDWEDYRAGMLSLVPASEMIAAVERAVGHMRRTSEWVEWMGRVPGWWPVSTHRHLALLCGNPRAWLGQSGMHLWTGARGMVTKRAWWMLTPGEQSAANDGAQRVIDEYLAARDDKDQMGLFR